MSELRVRRRPEDRFEPVSDFNPIPVALVEQSTGAPTFRGVPYSADYLWRLATEQKLYLATDADQNDMVTGQTSFAATTPTFLLDVPQGKTALPLFLNLSQSGTVAGADITVIIELAKVKRYASGGTAESIVNPSTLPTAADSGCSFYSGATASGAYGATVFRAGLAPDVSPAEGAVQGPFWKPELPYLLHGPATLLVFTYAGTTGPTWLWNFGFACWDTKELVV